MSPLTMRRYRLTFLCSLLAAVLPARAVILYRTGDAQANTTAPTGALAGSGWEFQGNFYGFQGTPIAPHFFLTARHLGFPVGTPFAYQGVTYHTVAKVADLESDLCIWRVDGTFPSHAPLFTRLNPAGEGLVVFGRGTLRGDAVYVPADGGELAGWKWGVNDGQLRWGTNTAAGVQDGGPGFGRLLYATFDADGGPEEAQLSVGDSGGGVFIRDGDGAWKLAGINYGVSGNYSRSADGADAFDAAIFRGNGLYENNGYGQPYVVAGPGLFAATEVAARLDFIRFVLDGKAPLARVGNDVLFSFDGEDGKNYRVEFCSDLSAGSWTPLGGNVGGNGGTLVLTDHGAAAQPRRFYRVVTLP